MNKVIIGGIYKHYKGNLYKIVAISKNSETLEDMVVYQAMYGNNEMWVRPKDMFFEDITTGDGQIIPRFVLVEKHQ